MLGEEQLPAPRGLVDLECWLEHGGLCGRAPRSQQAGGARRCREAKIDRCLSEDQYHVFFFLFVFGQKSSFCKIAAFQFLGTRRNPKVGVALDT